MDKQEEQFIRRINAKEEEGFKELFEKYYRYLVIAARRYVETRDEAEDIVQDAIFNLMQRKKLSIHHQFATIFIYFCEKRVACTTSNANI